MADDSAGSLADGVSAPMVTDAHQGAVPANIQATQVASSPTPGALVEQKIEAPAQAYAKKIPGGLLILSWLIKNWLLILVTILGLVLFAGLVWWIWKRHGDDFKLRWQAFLKKPEIPPNELLGILRSFYATIPSAIRKHVRHYPVYVVMGDARSGKTELISRFAYVDAQAQRYHFSHTSHPLVQIYLTQDALIIELASALVLSTSGDYANALLRLLRRLPVTLQLIMVINAKEMPPIVGEPPRSMIIDAMLGKLALISEINEREVPFRVVLTHMDEVPGYLDFRHSAIQENIDTRVRLRKSQPLASFRGGLGHLFGYMNNVLVNHKPESFIATLHFLDHVDALFSGIEQQLVSACQRAGLSSSQLVQLALLGISPLDTLPDPANNPFLSLDGYPGVRRAYSPKHLCIAGSLATVLILAQCLIYWSQKSNIEDAFAMIRRIPDMSAEQYAKEAHPVFQSLYPPDGSFFSIDSLSYILHHYFSVQINQARNELIHSIRTNYLIPRLELAQYQANAYAKTVRAMALLHASRNNELSEYFGEVLPAFNLGIPYPLVKDYITFNDDIHDSQMQGLALRDYGVLEAINHDDLLPWKTMGVQLRTLLGKRYITQEELNQVQDTGKQLANIIEKYKEYNAIDQQRHWLERNGHVSQLTLAEWRRHPTQSQLGYGPLEESLRLVMDARIGDEIGASNIHELLIRLEQVIERNKVASNLLQITGVVQIEVSDKVFIFNQFEWQALILRSKLKIIMDDFLRTHYSIDGWSFFDQKSHSHRLPMGVSTDSLGVISNNFQVDERLTRSMFDSQVKPAVESLAVLLPKLTLDNPEKQHLVDFVVQNLSVYASHYASNYWSFFSEMQIRINNPYQLLQYLRELQRPGSEFYQNLIAIRENIILDIPPGPNFQAFREEMENFRFLHKLLEEQAGNFPQLMRYMQLIIEINDDLNKPKRFVPVENEKEVGSGLQMILSPMGRLAMDIILNSDNSYLRKTEEWVREMAIPDHWKRPFLLPIEKLRDYGRMEINQSIASGWSDLWGRTVQPLLGFFPFDANQTDSGNQVSPEQMAAVFHPMKGEFWLGVNTVFRNLFVVTNGQWVPVPQVAQSLQFPLQMIARLNASAQLTSMLWGPEGNPLPIQFETKADLLPDLRVQVDEDDLPHASLAYLRSGESSVLGFNQHINWQKFKYEWWQRSPASVGVEFISGDQKVKKYSGVDVDESVWSFFRLLQQADLTEKNHYYWTIPHPLAPEHRIRMGYAFQKNPFDVFNALRVR